MSSPVPLKRIARINPEKLPDDTAAEFEFQYVDIGSVGRGRLIEEPSTLTFADAPSRARRVLRPGDTIVSTVRTYLRAVMPVQKPGLVGSTGFACLRPGREVDARLLGWWAQSDGFIEEVVARSVGVSYPAINPSELGLIRFPMRPVAEQRAIADYLDTETARIDALIAKKEHLRAKLAERRLALSRWLLAGPETPGARKPGPTGWLDSVPECWDLVRVGRLFEVQLGRMLNQERSVGLHQRPYMRNANVGWGRIDTSDVAEMDFPPGERIRYRLRPGDLLICEGGAGVAECAVWRGQLSECYYQKSLHRVRSRTELPVEWLAEWLRLWKAAGAHEAEGNLATIPHLTAEQLRGHRIPVPPPGHARARLAELERQAQRGVTLDSILERQARLLREHRQALITAAVTGELRVPGVAA